MNRRQFLTGSAVLAAGCGRKRPAPPTVANRTQYSGEARNRHIEMLQGFKVEPTATFTTPKASFDVLSVAPELKGLIKVSLRLHPRYSQDPAADASRLGGEFLWPAGDPWPTHEAVLAHVPVLQLRAEDAPPNWPFPPDTDLFQLLWAPTADEFGRPVHVAVRWRKRSTIQDVLSSPTPDEYANPDLVPVACRLFPERVMEFPNVEAVPGAVRDKLTPTPGLDLYRRELSVADGTKVGGYPKWNATPDIPACSTCKWGMDYLLTIADQEWTDASAVRWRPTESSKPGEGFRRAAGLRFGDRGNVQLFTCRRCEDRPVTLV